MMDTLHQIILIPILAGIVLFFIPERFYRLKSIVSLVIAGFVVVWSVIIFGMGDQIIRLDMGYGIFDNGTTAAALMNSFSEFTALQLDALSKLLVLLAAIFAILILAYSVIYITKENIPLHYYSAFLITIGCAAGAIMADNLLLLIFFWGVLGYTLFVMMRGNTQESASAAKKTFIMIGSSDGIMILGLAILWKLDYSVHISAMSVPTADALQVIAFLCLLIGAFTKAGAFPLHTWIPDYAQHAPASSSAYLPASLDKLLGIYLLSRLCNDIFILNQWLTLTLIIIGVLTIIIGVLMALVQHNYKRLLGYHAVSQVGYMITGLAMGTPLGIAGGLFHMVNNAFYKSGLFLAAGAVSRATGKEDISETGGLSKLMPLTFFAALIFAMSISGIPPFNGFASKWLIYQGIVEFGTQPGVANQLWIVWLGLAVFGSALTLASFMKFISGIFWGPLKNGVKLLKKENPLLWIPQLLIATACIVMGVFATNFIIPKIFMPITGTFEFFGMWQSSLVSLMVVGAIALGILIYLLGRVQKFRVEDNFFLGEKSEGQTGFSPLEYYKTISKAGLLSFIYRKAEQKWFDIYDLSKSVVLGFSKGLSVCHNGLLPLYLIWILAGLLIMLVIFI